MDVLAFELVMDGWPNWLRSDYGRSSRDGKWNHSSDSVNHNNYFKYVFLYVYCETLNLPSIRNWSHAETNGFHLDCRAPSYHVIKDNF